MTHPHDELVPSSTTIRNWISTVCARGIRRPGSAVDAWAERWIATRFRQLGLHNVALEDVRLPRWEPRGWSLSVWSIEDSARSLDLACFPLPHSAPAAGGLEAPVLELSDGDVAGAHALSTVSLMQTPQTLMRDRALRYHDPDSDFDALVHTVPFGPALQAVMEPAVDAGAAGFIGVFDAPWESCDYYVPYDAVERPIPGAWISRGDGERVRELMRRGPVLARLVVDSVREQVLTHNVVARLPGASEEWVVIGSHHDGPWVSAVEDASGIALVLAQAAYWSRVPESMRPHNLMFMVTSGHMCAGAGTEAFIKRHGSLLDRVVLEVHLEHTAKASKGVDGELVATDDPEIRWWFTTPNTRLLDSVERALVAEDLRRSLVLPPEIFGPRPTTDGGFFHTAGVPLVNFLTAPMYLFDSRDEMDKIHEPSLAPVTKAAIRIIADTAGVSAAAMRETSES